MTQHMLERRHLHIEGLMLTHWCITAGWQNVFARDFTVGPSASLVLEDGFQIGISAMVSDRTGPTDVRPWVSKVNCFGAAARASRWEASDLSWVLDQVSAKVFSEAFPGTNPIYPETPRAAAPRPRSFEAPPRFSWAKDVKPMSEW
eukprot:CAMPEP_0181405552 /NCGR_PEP_ID=MMETSP1110-20121109/4817_1 /TAXON_ID=174948 /ORGANISM="Symbiodinium sp., Strain CCMP421" /LENGTH=145 /DNA_ID=CAMNT_0023527941 /DNA_START=213 /DNA_END=651 /DNA_ORIENTATION=-